MSMTGSPGKGPLLRVLGGEKSAPPIWIEVFSRFDACGAPVNSIDQPVDEPHLPQRGTVLNRMGWLDAAPVPRLSGFNREPQPRATPRGRDTREVLTEFG